MVSWSFWGYNGPILFNGNKINSYHVIEQLPVNKVVKLALFRQFELFGEVCVGILRLQCQNTWFKPFDRISPKLVIFGNIWRKTWLLESGVIF